MPPGALGLGLPHRFLITTGEAEHQLAEELAALLV